MSKFPVWMALVALLATLAGCGSAISGQVMANVDETVTFEALVSKPEQYVGRTVVFSGSIVETVNRQDGTELVIVQHPSAPGRRPRDLDVSAGRFLARDSRFLDEAIYEPGRLVTVAGKVTGAEKRALGNTEYNYPILRVEELHLWRESAGFHWGFLFSTQF